MNRFCAKNFHLHPILTFKYYQFSRYLSKWAIEDNKWGNISFRPRWGQFSLGTNRIWCDQIFSPNFGWKQTTFWDRLTWSGVVGGSDRVIGSPPCEPLWVSLSTFRLATAWKARVESTPSKKCEASAQNAGCTEKCVILKKCVMPARKCVMPPSQGCHPQNGVGRDHNALEWCGMPPLLQMMLLSNIFVKYVFFLFFWRKNNFCGFFL